MADGTKVWVSLPDRLLARLDRVARESGTSRDDVLRRAVESFVGRSHVSGLGDIAGLSEAMVRGYRAMADLNLALAEEDGAALVDWPAFDDGPPEAGERGDP